VRPESVTIAKGINVNVIGIGTDIVDCARIAKMIEKHGELFICRVYTDLEIGYCSSRKEATQHYAGRWAAKEAVLKALGTGWARGIQWRDIEIRNDVVGKPSVHLFGGAKKAADKIYVDKMMISISHCRTHATAYAMAIERTSGDDIPF